MNLESAIDKYWNVPAFYTAVNRLHQQTDLQIETIVDLLETGWQYVEGVDGIPKWQAPPEEEKDEPNEQPGAGSSEDCVFVEEVD